MKQIKFVSIIMFILFSLNHLSYAVGDQNVMDDIGFDNTFAYYSSANEDINMQTGNIMLQIPVSPMYPGPEGSGLDLQLKMFYNSSFWRYESDDSYAYESLINFSRDEYYVPAPVDTSVMYFSPVGIGWSLHMGRLFRRKERISSFCDTEMFLFEDPSGAMHRFGPYPDENNINRNLRYDALDGEGYVLLVKDYYGEDADREIVIFDGTGKKYYFGGDILSVPALPYEVYENGVVSFNTGTSDDEVLYVTKIESYKNPNNKIEISYLNSSSFDGDNVLYSSHLIDKIVDSFGREIKFEYDLIPIQDNSIYIPCLSTLEMPGFTLPGSQPNIIKYKFTFSLDNFVEPWYGSDCHHDINVLPDHPLPVEIPDQLFLEQINLPDDLYSHLFDYNESGEIVLYENPFGAKTEYEYKNIITQSIDMVKLFEDSQQRTVMWNYYRPSRFIHKKTLEMNNINYIWEYKVITTEYQDKCVFIVQGDGLPFYTNVNTFGETGIKDPDGNETIFEWINESFYCKHNDGSSYPWSSWPKKPKEVDCPDKDNSKNGRLKEVKYYENSGDSRVIKKSERYEYTDGESVSGLACHDNKKIFKKNIRQESIETRLYAESKETYVSTKETFDYDDFGNIKLIISQADGLPDIVTERVYYYWENELNCDNPYSSNYKVDALYWEYAKAVDIENGEEVISGVCNEYDTGKGRVTQKQRLIENNSAVLETTLFNYTDDRFQLNWKQIDSQPATLFCYEYGALAHKIINNIWFENNVIDPSTGLVIRSIDTANNETEYAYDVLFRLSWIKQLYDSNDEPSGRYPLDIKYNGKEITYERRFENGDSVVTDRYILDEMGNPSYHKTHVYGDNGKVEAVVMMDSTYDWKGQVVRAIHPGTDIEITYNYDVLGRPTRIIDSDSEADYVYTVLHGDNKTKTTIAELESVDYHGSKTYRYRNYMYDTRGNLLEAITGEPAGSATYTYDFIGNLIEVNHGDTLRAYTYDLLGRKTQLNEPERGVVNFEYYPDGKLHYEYTPEGKITYEYDGANRLKLVTVEEGSLPYFTIRGLAYDQTIVTFPTGETCNIRNGNGRLTSAWEGRCLDCGENNIVIDFVIARSYNTFGELESESLWINPDLLDHSQHVYTTDYYYNGWGNQLMVKLPSSEVYVVYSNDIILPQTEWGPGNGLNHGPWTTKVYLADITHPDSWREIAKNVSYNKIGALKKITYDNNTHLSFHPDNRNRIEKICVTSNQNKTIWEDSYQYDRLDRITAIGDMSYNYNEDGSLQLATDGLDNHYEYSYDSSGNMTSRESSSGILTFSNFEFENNRPNDRIYSDREPFSFDLNGNMTYNHLTNHTYQFSAENKLKQIDFPDGESIKVFYDHDNRRRLKIAEGNTAELFFYDLTGNNLLEKLTFDISDETLTKLNKNECYINLGKHNIAQFNYFHPVVTIELDPNQTTFFWGDDFKADAVIKNEGSAQDVWLFIVLEVLGEYYIHSGPDDNMWLHYQPDGITPPDFQYGFEFPLSHGLNTYTFLDLTIPIGIANLENMRFYTFMTTSNLEGVDKKPFGNIATKLFHWKQPLGDLFVKPGSLNGDGTIENPYNSIQYAIDMADTSGGSRVTVKLFPGTYDLDEDLIVDKPGIDIIGSGQNKTFISGDDAFRTVILNNGADSVIQNLSSEINLLCNSASPKIQDVHLLRNDSAIAGVIATNNSYPILTNCLIAKYLTGVLVEDSSVLIRNTTISDCSFNIPDYDGVALLVTGNNPSSIIIEESIITFSDFGIFSDNPNVNIEALYSNIYGNRVNYSVAPGTLNIGDGVMSVDPLFVSGPDHNYYLSSISTRHRVNSPCLNAGFPTFDLSRMIIGTTRTDGLFGTFPRDLGYHGMMFNRVIDMGNINNQGFELDNALSLIRYGAIDETGNILNQEDPNDLLRHGTQDVLVISTSTNKMSQFTLYFREGNWLMPQNNTHSPLDVVDAAIQDVNGDNLLDLIVADESGVLLYLNDSSGNMVYTSWFYTATPRAIEVIDLNNNGLSDILVATAQGVWVYIAEDHQDYVIGQWLDTGDTTAMLLDDFNGNGLSDLITINQLGTIQFFKNMGESGLVAVGSPVQAQGSGPLKALDVLQNNRRELVVELAPNIEQVFDVGDIFGFQPIASSGKRSIRYVYFDHLGSAKMLINDQRRVVWPELKGGLNRLSPFGKDLVVGDDPPDIVRESYLLNFTNKEIDYTLDLHYFGARYYHSTFPRFISPDPVGGNPMLPITWNRYLYCRNDPVNYFDPNGEDSYLVSRPLHGNSRRFAHLFIVTHAEYLGDPSAEIVSFGQNDAGNLGRVDGNTTNRFSAGTNSMDAGFWDALGNGDPDVAAVQIQASDDRVLFIANSVIEDQDYSAICSIGPIVFGINSNSAALAVAERASCQVVVVPGDLAAPGVQQKQAVNFDTDRDGEPD